MTKTDTTPVKRLRFAIYTRYSSEMQNELSLEAQEARCRAAIAERGGTVVAVYSDSAKSGWSLERDGFIVLREAAEHGKFDAVMFWKFDRLARNHEHVVMIKMLLRHEYGLKLYCVEGFSEDEDDSAYTAMMEQMIAVFSAFYSKNLSSETKRGKRQRALKGEFNGSIAPLGYDLVTKAQATEEKPAGLYINPRAAALVRRAFRLYATGKLSDADVAEWLNQRPHIKRLRKDQKPINKEMIRDLLQNRVYTGRVRYTETVYRGSLGERRTSKRHRSEWFEGLHGAIISDELFNECEAVRSGVLRSRTSPSKERIYVLHDRVYCARCAVNKPVELIDDNYGRMHAKYQTSKGYAYYRCIARQRGYDKCCQCAVPVLDIDNQLVEALATLKLPPDYRELIDHAVRSRAENKDAFERIEQVKAKIGRLNFSWQEGYLEQDIYVEQRRQLEAELQSLRPIDQDNLLEAADILANFSTYWWKCAELPQPEVGRQQLIAKAVERIFVYDGEILAVVLNGDYAVLIGGNEKAPTEIADALGTALEGTKKDTLSSVHFGDDGVRTRDLCLDRAAC